MKQATILLSVFMILLVSCNKGPLDENRTNTGTSSNNTDPTTVDNQPKSKSILVDASKDGGGWWFPQSPLTGFTSYNQHQGKALADYLRNLGYKVDELPRGAIITSDLLNNYSKVIRATAFFPYSADEITAYKSFLDSSSSLLLISDHMQNTTNDLLSASLGLVFESSYSGQITAFRSHAITNGVSSLNYIAGSVLRSWDPSKITVLGSLNAQYGVDGAMVGAMGTVNHPTSRIFFIGDVNGIELLPQPFTTNLFEWLFK